MGTARRGRSSLKELRSLERAILREWSARHARIFTTDPTLNFERRAEHGEHCVGFDPANGCWWKTTHPGKAGVGAEFLYEDLPPFRVMAVIGRELLPSEYLERIALQNEEFGDDVRYEGFLDSEEPSLIISQPDIAGTPATAAEMKAQMLRFGYLPLDKLQLGRHSSISFYHPHRRIALFDAHPGNFFRTAGGIAIPVDAILSKTATDAEHAWLMTHTVPAAT